MDRIKIGSVLKTQGVKGELKIGCDNAGDYVSVEHLYIMGRALVVEKSRANENFLYVKFQGIDRIEDAEIFRGQNVFASKLELDVLEDGEYYIDDLIGCVVIGNQGTNYGIVINISNYGSKDVYTIKNNDKEYLFACVENLLLEVNIEKKTIVVDEKILAEVLV